VVRRFVVRRELTLFETERPILHLALRKCQSRLTTKFQCLKFRSTPAANGYQVSDLLMNFRIGAGRERCAVKRFPSRSHDSGKGAATLLAVF
jgi:hypothetical protein